MSLWWKNIYINQITRARRTLLSNPATPFPGPSAQWLNLCEFVQFFGSSSEFLWFFWSLCVFRNFYKVLQVSWIWTNLCAKILEFAKFARVFYEFGWTCTILHKFATCEKILVCISLHNFAHVSESLHTFVGVCASLHIF